MEFHIVLDCTDPDALADFWTEALGYARVTEVDQFVVLAAKEQAGLPLLLLQRVPEQRTGKNRCHFDFTHADPEAEAERLVRLGATRDPGGSLQLPGGIQWVRMTDPEGNEFCVCRQG